MIYIGIDPGITGAVAIIDGQEIEFHDTPVIRAEGKSRIDSLRCAEILCDLSLIRGTVIIERVHAMPKQGVTSMFTFGYGAGIWEGILAALKIRYQFATPQAWKKIMMAGEPKGQDSRLVARRLYPVQCEEALSRKKDHGRADALLLAEYGRRMNL